MDLGGGKKTMNLTFVVSPIVGSVIGYCTNWVAIKMLFRPLEEKKILGMKVPFTPGVIPRRRGKLAESIGNTVGERLLTPDAFQRILEGEEMQKKVKEFIREGMEGLEEEERSLKEITKEIIPDPDKRKDLELEVKKVITKGLQGLLTSENIKDLITEELENMDSADLNVYFKSEEYQKLKAKLKSVLLAYLHNEQTEKKLASLLEEKIVYLKQKEQTVGDVLPTAVAADLKEFLSDQGPEIVDRLVGFLSSDTTKERINRKIEEVLENKPLMQMIGGFVDKEKIINQFVDHIIKFLNESENQEELVEQVDKLFDSLLETKLATLAEKFEGNLPEVAEFTLTKLVSEDVLDNLLTGLESSLMYQVDNGQVSASKDEFKLNEVIDQAVKDLTESQFLFNFLEGLIYDQLTELSNRPLAFYFEYIPKETIRKLESNFLLCIEYVIKNHVGDVLATLDFEEMIKKKVDTFEVLEVESLILNVIETELQAITWFGAVLGLIMGLITPFISMVMG